MTYRRSTVPTRHNDVTPQQITRTVCWGKNRRGREGGGGVHRLSLLSRDKIFVIYYKGTFHIYQPLRFYLPVLLKVFVDEGRIL